MIGATEYARSFTADGMLRLVPLDKTDRHILKKWVKDGIEHAFHATKGLRRRRINT